MAKKGTIQNPYTCSKTGMSFFNIHIKFQPTYEDLCFAVYDMVLLESDDEITPANIEKELRKMYRASGTGFQYDDYSNEEIMSKAKEIVANLFPNWKQ